MNAAVGSAEGVSLSLIGVPNCGKTALLNRLTGSRQKVANYPGVTVERKEGRFIGPVTGHAIASSIFPARTASSRRVSMKRSHVPGTRVRNPSDDRNSFIGFRVARTLDH